MSEEYVEPCVECGQTTVRYTWADLEKDEFADMCEHCQDKYIDEVEYDCEFCHDLGGNRYDDGATPCPYCQRY